MLPESSGTIGTFTSTGIGTCVQPPLPCWRWCSGYDLFEWDVESFLLWFQACQIRLQDLIRQLQGHFQDRGVIVQHLLQARLHHPQQVMLRLENERIELKVTSLQWLCQLWLMKERGNPLDSEIQEWLQEFREHLKDDEISEHWDSHASFFHEVSWEPIFKRRENLGRHSVYTHFPKDRNCEICKRTKITRAPCRRRKGEAVPRADNFGDLITADHKVLSDNCESRNNHRYAVVVQDLATQWIQAYPCKTQTSQETQRSLQKFLETRKEA